MPRFPKGSQEAKDYMASIRAKKGGSMKGTGGKSSKIAPTPDPLTDPEYLALMAESERIMKEMKERVEMLKKQKKKRGD